MAHRYFDPVREEVEKEEKGKSEEKRGDLGVFLDVC